MLEIFFHAVGAVFISLMMVLGTVVLLRNFAEWCSKKAVEFIAYTVYILFVVPLLLHIPISSPAAHKPAQAPPAQVAPAPAPPAAPTGPYWDPSWRPGAR